MIERCNLKRIKRFNTTQSLFQNFISFSMARSRFKMGIFTHYFNPKVTYLSIAWKLLIYGFQNRNNYSVSN